MGYDPVYDLVIVGGGLAGSALATVMVQSGARVLVLEQEARFRDRVRGEGMHPWGVAEARTLGLYEPLRAACGHEVPGWVIGGGPMPPQRRDLLTTTPHAAGSLNYHHPEMQETLLALARDVGAEVRRGATVTGVVAGSPPQVTFEQHGATQAVTARLVVGADGRFSRVRRWSGFTVERDPERLLVAGVLMAGLAAPDDAVHLFPSLGQAELAILFPLGRDRTRAYFATARRAERARLSGAAQVPAFIRASIEAGVPAAWFEQARAIGPLASFEGAASWVEHPERDGVVLVGDAAAAVDSTWGCGQSLTLRDVRVLRDALCATSDWETAAHSYADEHDHYFGALHTVEAWMTEIFFTRGPEGDRIRAQALPHFARGAGIDLVGLGPETPVDDAMRRRLFGADAPMSQARL